MNDLIERNYKATRKRGQITDKTTDKDFIVKLKEEIKELEDSFDETETLLSFARGKENDKNL
jgi:hypothetical protein